MLLPLWLCFEFIVFVESSEHKMGHFQTKVSVLSFFHCWTCWIENGSFPGRTSHFTLIFFFQIYYVICSKFQIWFHFPQYSCPVYVSFCLNCSYLFIYWVNIFYIMWILKTVNRLLNLRNILNINMLSNEMFFKDFLLKFFL